MEPAETLPHTAPLNCGAAAEDDALVPRLERYELQDRLGRGGMGSVYRARDRATGQTVALKCVYPHTGRHAKLVLQGFEREFQVLRGLDHPRIIQVFDYGVLQGGAYYTMELLEGDDLRKCGPLAWRKTCLYLRDIATSLSLLHARRLIHRDLGPGNVKQTDDGHCKLIDFGALCDFGQTNTLVGTPPFIAPEALRTRHVDQRTDLYSLGAVGYYCLTGVVAYPARHIGDLESVWLHAPARPSAYVDDIPADLDDLLMRLLAQDPLARPNNVGEVIAQLEEIADLPPENAQAQQVLAESFLSTPRFVGRGEQLERVSDAIRDTTAGRGCALRLSGPSGAGRTRFLDEVAIRGQLAGAALVRVDAAAQSGRYGSARAMARSMLAARPELSRRIGAAHAEAFAPLNDVALSERLRETETLTSELVLVADHARQREARHTESGSVPGPPSQQVPGSVRDSAAQRRRALHATQDASEGLEHWFIDVSHECPLVILIDNIEHTDDVSFGVLLGLTRAAAEHPIFILWAERSDHEQPASFGLRAMQAVAGELPIGPLSPEETGLLMDSMFGATQRVERFTDWMYEDTAGSPLHCLGLVRDLVHRQVLRYERGGWLLPSARPDTKALGGLQDALFRRIEQLSPDARLLVQSLCLERVDPTAELCERLVAAEAERSFLSLREELAAADVIHQTQERWAFSSSALRRAVRARMDSSALERSHQRLGDALAQLAGASNLALRIDAGWHLIRAGDDLRGAALIQSATHDPMQCNTLVANLYRIGEPVEAALQVYRAHRRSRRERMPLLSVLAQAGYFEHYTWADRYGDDALDLVEDLSGLRLARRLKPLLGKFLAVNIGMGLALLRHYTAPRGERGTTSFLDVLVHLCAVVTTLTAAAAIRLDGGRCDRVTQLLELTDALPKRMGVVGVYRFCQGLRNIPRENQREAFSTFEEIVGTFSREGYYLLTPPEAQILYLHGGHFARGSFAMMRADGSAALESAAILERSGSPLYMMIAAQLRRLYHLNRGEFAAAEAYDARVENHAARVGSAWQVEVWELPVLIPLYLATEDLAGLQRVQHRLSLLGESMPSMRLFRELTRVSIRFLRTVRDPGVVDAYEALLSKYEPREYQGWANTVAYAAHACNLLGDFERARSLCEGALAHMQDADRDYTMLFLPLELFAAHADAGLGHVEQAFQRLEQLIERHAHTEHPLALGLLHEARARIAFEAGDEQRYLESLDEARRWFLPTGTPSLLDKCERLQALAASTAAVQPLDPLPDFVTGTTEEVPTSDSQ